MPAVETKNQNRLIFEKSPYLLQHAYNPVDWFPWGEEAFNRAGKENKPIFLSIGYSTCHWCHVMARESFEDPDIAELMNRAFVNIKVDREERPDLDSYYMTVSQAISGEGGWPLTIIMTPEKEPFFASTYIPRESRFGRIGMTELIPEIKSLWRTQAEELAHRSKEITMRLSQTLRVVPGRILEEPVLHQAYQDLLDRFDGAHGGFGTAPKFPRPHNVSLLLRYWKRTGKNDALDMVEKTLDAMFLGGIHDHIGFGFHRYSTDADWLVPHFEKMLYDQALLAIAYTEAYQATGKEEYEEAARTTFEYVLREMRGPEGAFYSAQDAESEGEEGKFYLWTVGEIIEALGRADADLFMKVFNIKKEGNFRDEISGEISGRNIPHLKRPIGQIASTLDMPEQELRNKIESARKKLFEARESRTHPGKDDKILTDWNGLMIAALAKGAQVFGNTDYSYAARFAADFVIGNMMPTGRLLHRYRDGEAAINAYLDDYSFLIWGLLEIYEDTFNAPYLQVALDLNKQMIERFWDNENGGFFFTAEDNVELPIREKNAYDGAVPSGNSVAMMNLLRLGRITSDPELEKKAENIGRVFSGSIYEYPTRHTHLLSAFDFALGPSEEIVIVGRPEAEDTRELIRTVKTRFIPNKVLLFRPEGLEKPLITSLAPMSDQLSMNGKATAYLCSARACRLKTEDPEELLRGIEHGGLT